MACDSLLHRVWDVVVKRRGGAATLAASAQAMGAFQRPRAVQWAADMLRLGACPCNLAQNWLAQGLQRVGR